MGSGEGYTISALREHPRLEGISYGEAQARLIRLAAVNPEWASRSGKRSAWIVSPAGLEVLVRLREIEKSGMSVDAGMALLQQELMPLSPQEARERAAEYSEATAPLEIENRWLKERLKDLEAQRVDLRAERDRLLGLLERVTPALPVPKSEPRRRWWERRKP